MEVWFDEASDIPRKAWRTFQRAERKKRAKRGWFNWYINRGRLALSSTRSELRRVSWRRAH